MTANQPEQQPQEPTETRDVTRRKVVVAGAGAVVAMGLGGAMAADAFAGEQRGESGSGGRAPVPEECYESFSEGGGTAPTDAPSGTPTDVPSGTPTGEPPAGGGGGGGVHEEPTSDTRYLRGTWKTDKQGFVTFETIFPGWYRGRCVHIHTKVHVNGEWTDAGYEGGTTCHTGQLFFDEESVLASAEVEPYSTSTTERTTLDDDTIYDGSGVQGGLLKLKYKKDGIAKGVVGSLTVGVDPEATNTGTGDSA